MFLLCSVIYVMALLYVEESALLLETWGFLAGLPARTGRNARVSVLQVGILLTDDKCTFPWKGIKVNDQILKINGTLVEKMNNAQIRELMLSSCSISSSTSPSTSAAADLTVEFTNATLRMNAQVDSIAKEKKDKINMGRERPSLKIIRSTGK